MKRIATAVAIVLATVFGSSVAAEELSNLRKLHVFRTPGQAFQIQAAIENGTALLMLTNGNLQFVMRRSVLLPAPSIRFVSGAMDEIILDWVGTPGVNNCCVVTKERWIDLEERECWAECEDCECMACYEPCDPVPPDNGIEYIEGFWTGPEQLLILELAPE